MDIACWQPKQAYSKQEQFLRKQLTRTRKLFGLAANSYAGPGYLTRKTCSPSATSRLHHQHAPPHHHLSCRQDRALHDRHCRRVRAAPGRRSTSRSQRSRRTPSRQAQGFGEGEVVDKDNNSPLAGTASGTTLARPIGFEPMTYGSGERGPDEHGSSSRVVTLQASGSEYPRSDVMLGPCLNSVPFARAADAALGVYLNLIAQELAAPLLATA